MEKVIAKIDGHIFKITESEYNAAFDMLTSELAKRDAHFDDSPFGSILNLCPADMVDTILNGDDDDHYWTRKILAGKKILNNFDLANYIRRNLDKPRPAPPVISAKERLAETRAWNSFFNY